MDSEIRQRKYLNPINESIEKKNIGKIAQKIFRNTFKYESKNNNIKIENIGPLEPGDTNITSYKCSYNYNDTQIPGRIYITQHKIIFHSQNLYADDEIRFQLKIQDFENVKKERKRTGSILEDTIRITLNDNTTYLFTNFKSINLVYKLIKTQSLKRSDSFDTIQDNFKKNLFKNKHIPIDRFKSLEQEYESDINDNDEFVQNQRSASFASLHTEHDSNSTENSDAVNDIKNLSVDQTEPQEEIDNTEEKKLDELYSKFGKEFVNLNLPINAIGLYQYLFEKNEFFESFWTSRKFYDFKFQEWEKVDKYKSRKLEYTMPGVVGSKFVKTAEIEKIIKFDPNSQIIVESESANKGIPYADAFTVHCRFIIKNIDENSCNLTVFAAVNFLYKPNFIAKTFIEKNCISGLNDSYFAFSTKLKKDIERLNLEQVSSKQFEQKQQIDESKLEKKSELLESNLNEITKNRCNDIIHNETNIINQSQITHKSIKQPQAFIHQIPVFSNSIIDAFQSPVYRLFIYLLILLLLINIYLVSKLNKLEFLVDKIDKCSRTCISNQI